MKRTVLLLLILLCCTIRSYGQDINLYEQFNGRYDFTFVGNTLNPSENNITPTCTIYTTSSADLNLLPDDTILHAYLYWAGSGTGDLDIKLNGVDVTATRTFPLQALNTDGNVRDYFGAWADVTSQVIATGNGTYTVSDLDLTAIVSQNLYCGIKTNFGGWAIIVIYENPALPLNQLNLYDGMGYVPTAINITLPSLNVIDNEGAKIGFLAWEGDAGLAVNETLKINGNTLSNALNPPNNAFNGTNTVTGSNQLYNMDLDIYEIQDYINIGDASAEIQLTSGQDFVMINAIMTKLNSQLPDATITIEDVIKTCNSRTLQVNYTVHNDNSTDVLPAGTQVGVYVNGNLLTTFATTVALPIGGSQSGTINLTIPAGYPDDFQLLFVVDYNFAIVETDETNNSTLLNESLWIQANVNPGDITACETAPGSNTGYFDLTALAESLKDDDTDVVTFYTSMADAQVPTGAITLSASYQSGPDTLYIRIVDANGCVGYGDVNLLLDDCLFPDAVISVVDVVQQCNSRVITINYTVGNPNGLDVLPAGVPIGFYANNVLIGTTATTTIIPINGTENGTVTLTIPNGIPLSFNLLLRVDNGNIVQELNETNNTFTQAITLWTSPFLTQIPNLTECETTNGSNIGIFDFSAYEASLKNDPTDIVRFYTNSEDAEEGNNNFITTPENYTSNGTNPQTIYVRLQDANGCYSIGTFQLIVVDCLFPDGVIYIDSIIQQCDSRQVTVTYTVGNPDSFDILPAGTPIAMYANGTLLAQAQTAADIPVNDTLVQTVVLNFPTTLGLNIDLTFVIDDNGTGTGIVQETNELNNASNLFSVTLWVSPVLQQPADIDACETFNGSGVGSFNFAAYAESLKNTPTDTVTFYTSQANADSETDSIPDTSAHIVADNSKVYVRLEDEHGCYDTKVFTLHIIDCYFPDATVTIDDIYKQCNSRILHVHYTVSNINGTDVLPAATPVSIYVNGVFLDYTETLEDIAIGESESGYITLTIPVGVPLNFDLTFVADDNGNGTGIVIETDETNNSFTLPAELVLSPVLQQPDDIINCDRGLGLATFDFSAYAESLKNYANETVTFYTSQQMADQDLDRIYNTSAYQTEQNPQRIYVRLDNGTCFTTASFLLRTKKCKPITYNYVTPNGDNINDTFFVEGLRNVFLNFTMKIYNRWGNLVWTGDHSKDDWNGIANEEKVGSKETTVPNGTYYFVLELNDPDYPEPIVGWVYVTM